MAESVTKPSRSDEVLDPDQQLQIANQIRHQFDSMVPKRPTKPNRSEPDSSTPLSYSVSDEPIPVPEFDKLLSLQSQAIFSENVAIEHDEFVETQYYKELNSVDKQHHTTGSGFIKMVDDKGEERNALDQLHIGVECYNNGGCNGDIVFKSNPATNDWTPSIEFDQVSFVSAKPNRSESG